jgi:hypothetical protein
MDHLDLKIETKVFRPKNYPLSHNYSSIAKTVLSSFLNTIFIYYKLTKINDYNVYLCKAEDFKYGIVFTKKIYDAGFSFSYEYTEVLSHELICYSNMSIYYQDIIIKNYPELIYI